MEFTVQNNSLLYSVSFTEETARISIRDLSNGFYETILNLPITVWHIIEHQRQQFDTYHQGQVPITENQLGTHEVGHEVAVISGHHYPHVYGTDFPDNYVAGSIQYTFPWEEGQIPNNWFNTPETSQVSSPEQQSRILQIVSNAGSSQQSELSVDTSTTWSFNDLENFDPAQYYGSTDMSTTPSMTTPSIEDGTAHNPIVLTDEVPVTPISVRPTEPPAIVERVRPFGNEIQNLPDHVVRTLFE